MTQTYPITLDVSKLDTLHTGYAFVQNDRKVHELVFSVSGLEITAQSTAELRFLRPDNQVVVVESDQLTVSGGKVHYVVQSNVLEKAGVAHGILSVSSEGGRRSTGQFTFTVAGDIDAEEAIMGDDRLPILQQLLEAMEESALLCEQSENDAKDYAEQAAASAREASTSREATASEKVKAEEAAANAQGYAAGAATSEANAAESASAASQSASAASQSASAASQSAYAASASAGTASERAREAITARDVAVSEKTKAEEAAANAQSYAANAGESATAAQESLEQTQTIAEEIRENPISPDMCTFMTPYENLAKEVNIYDVGGQKIISLSVEAGLCYTLFYENKPIPFLRLDAGGTIDYKDFESKGTGSFVLPEDSSITHVDLRIDSSTYPDNESLGVYQTEPTSLDELYYVNTNANDKHIEEKVDEKKVTEIDENADDAHYPSVKAVKDYVDLSVAKIAVDSWEGVQSVVRSGLAPKVFSIGDQLICNHETYGELVWDIIGFDHDVPVDRTKIHSMTIQLHSPLSDSFYYDSIEALYYAETELPVGTYNFTLLAGYDETYGGGKTYSFTLANPVPAGGHVLFKWGYHQQAAECKISTYESQKSSSAIESIGVTEGSAGTALALTNHTHRARYGYNRWSQSAIRQWLNSDKAGGAWWNPLNDYDRPSPYNTKAGFLNGIDADFLSALGEVTKRNALNTITDGGGYEDTTDIMFIISRGEAYGGDENGIDEGTPYPYYSEYSDLTAAGTGADANRIKYNNDSAKSLWLRSCQYTDGSHVRYVNTSGSIISANVCDSLYVSPACNII